MSSVKQGAAGESFHFLSRCLVGTFNDPFNYIPNHEVIQKWFLNRWKVSAGLKVTPMSHNQFLFEFPSRQEAVRVHAGDWFWNGRHLSLKWWSPVTGTDFASQRSEQKWIKAFGIPINASKLETFRTIGDICVGFIGIDLDTKYRNHFIWARICVSNSSKKCPEKITLDLENWCYEISILKDVAVPPKPVRVAGAASGIGSSQA